MLNSSKLHCLETLTKAKPRLENGPKRHKDEDLSIYNSTAGGEVRWLCDDVAGFVVASLLAKTSPTQTPAAVRERRATVRGHYKREISDITAR